MNHKALISGVLLYILIVGVFVSFRHYNFQTQGWDMGIFAQSLWNTSEGRVMQNTLEDVPNHFGVHFSPGLLLLIPGYMVFESPYYLLWIQTLALALGALPLYFLSKKVLDDERISLLIAFAYLLFPSLHWVNIFDFHEIAFFVPLFIAAVYFIEVQRFWLSVLFLLLAASFKEDAALIIFFAGLFMLVKYFFRSDGDKNKSPLFPGTFILLFSLLYSVITLKFLMP